MIALCKAKKLDLNNKNSILTLSMDRLSKICLEISKFPHPYDNTGELRFEDDVFSTPNRETNISISKKASFDLTGNITIGSWVMIGGETRLITHDHYYMGREKTIIEMEEEKGVWWSDLVIGSDIWIHNSIILPQVTNIPDGVVIGTNSVLTKNPGPYEIWAGNPAKKVGER